METISRAHAISKGLQHYYTGKPCSRGHLSLRTVPSGNCVECKKTIHSHFYKYSHDKGIRCHNARKRLNRHLIDKSKNRFQKWTPKEILAATQKNEDGTYTYTSLELANMLSRSYKSIERARNRYKENILALGND